MSMNINTGPATTSSSTDQQPIDYLSYIGSLTPTPFNPNTVINALLQADQIPITTLQTQIKAIQGDASTYANIANDISALQSAEFSLTLQSTTQAKTAASSNAIAVTATAGPAVQSGTYTVAVNNVATATVARSQTGVGQAIDAVAATAPLNTLNLNGAPTAGTFSVVVDGKVQTINVDPTKALLDPQTGPLTLLQSAIAQGIADDAGASVTVGVSNDRVSIGISGATAQHTISFGASGDTSNFLSLMGLTTARGATANGSLTLGSSAAVGVAQTAVPLASAGLGTALTPATGTFSINGTSIAWDSSVDSLNTIVGRINNSNAGVVAQYNNLTDQLVLANKATGQSAISLSDTMGNFLAAMNLSPGTTAAQQLGANASVTVNGATVISASNTVITAVPGLSINALAQTAQGSPATLTVAPDTTAITKSVQTFVDAVNKVIGDVNATQQKDASGHFSHLLGDPTLNGLKDYLLTTILGQVTSSGTYRSLQDIGITTGRVGSAPGSTSSLTLDAAKLAAALMANPDQVAALFNGTTSNNGFLGIARRLDTYLQPQTNPITGPFALQQTASTAQVKQLQDQITHMQSAITQRRKVLTAQFAAMSNVLSNLNAESAALSNFSISSTSSSSSGH